MTQEEESLYKKIHDLKQGYDKLYVIYEELDEMIKGKYTCSSCADETSGLFYAYNEYKKWRADEGK